MLNSQNISEQEMDGVANDATKNIHRRHRDYIALIISDEDVRIPDLTPITVSHFATAAINSGDTVTYVMITKTIWCEDWGNKDSRDYN